MCCRPFSSPTPFITLPKPSSIKIKICLLLKTIKSLRNFISYSRIPAVLTGGKMNNLVGQVANFIEKDISRRPDCSEQIAKSMLAILKIRNIQNFADFVPDLIEKLEKIAEEDSLVFDGLESAATLFSRLTDEDAEKVEQYLQSLMPEKESSLEKYLSEKLNTKSQLRDNTHELLGIKNNVILTNLAILASGYYENFELCLNNNAQISESEVRQLIENYYLEKRYQMPLKNDLCFRKLPEMIFVNFTIIYSLKIMITVMKYTH